MQIQSTAKEGLKQEFKVVIPFNDVEEKVIGWLQNRSKTVRIDGFRPGKIPVNILRQRFGSQALQETVQHFVQKSTQQIYKDHNIRIAGQPTYEMENIEDGKDFSFSVALESLPTFKVNDFSKLELEKLDISVSDKEVEEALAKLAENYKKFEMAKSDHKITSQDQVTINLSAFEGSTSLKNYTSKGLKFVLDNIPQELEFLKKALLGRKKDEKLEVEQNFDDKFTDKKLANKTVTFKIEIVEISNPVETKINDDFAKDFKCENLEDLRKKLKDNIQEEYNRLGKVYQKRCLLDALADEYAFDLPNNMVKNEFDNIWNRLKEEMALAKEKGELTSEEENKPLDSYEEEYKKIAERRVRLGLVVAEVARENNLQLTTENIRKLIVDEAMRYPGQEKKVVEFYRSHPHMVEQLSGPALEDKVIDFILTKVKFKNINLTYPELKKKLKGILPDYDDMSDEDENSSEETQKSGQKRKNSDIESKEEKPKKVKKITDKKDEGENL